DRCRASPPHRATPCGPAPDQARGCPAAASRSRSGPAAAPRRRRASPPWPAWPAAAASSLVSGGLGRPHRADGRAIGATGRTHAQVVGAITRRPAFHRDHLAGLERVALPAAALEDGRRVGLGLPHLLAA